MKTVYVLYQNGQDYEFYTNRASRRNGWAIPYCYFREAIEQAGYRFQPTHDYPGLATVTDAAYIISITVCNPEILSSIRKHPKERCLMVNLEPPMTHGCFYDRKLGEFFGKILVMQDDLVDNQTFFKFYHTQHTEEFVKDAPPFDQKKFCMQVQSNYYVEDPTSDYAERRKAAAFFARDPGFDLYGSGWYGFPAWRGSFSNDKVDVIKHYKFNLSYENNQQQGYITERLFQDIYARTIPVYFGASNIKKYVPENCFINVRDFSSYEELYRFMRSIDRYVYERYVQAGEAFLRSPKAANFLPKSFANSVLNYMEPA